MVNRKIIFHAGHVTSMVWGRRPMMDGQKRIQKLNELDVGWNSYRSHQSAELKSGAFGLLEESMAPKKAVSPIIAMLSVCLSFFTGA